MPDGGLPNYTSPQWGVNTNFIKPAFSHSDKCRVYSTTRENFKRCINSESFAKNSFFFSLAGKRGVRINSRPRARRHGGTGSSKDLVNAFKNIPFWRIDGGREKRMSGFDGVVPIVESTVAAAWPIWGRRSGVGNRWRKIDGAS